MNRLLVLVTLCLLVLNCTLPTCAQGEQNPLELVQAPPIETLYVGLPNTMDLAVKGVPSEYLKISIEGAKIIGGAGRYDIRCTRVGTAVLTLSDLRNNRQMTLTFPIKHLTDPIIQLDGRTEGMIGLGTLKAQLGLVAAFPDDPGLRGICKIVHYTLYYTPHNGTPIKLQGDGARFTGDIRRYIDQAQHGDQFAFVDIKVRCRWDRCAMRINGLSFMVR